MAKTCHPTTDLEFNWSSDYSFVWSNTTDLKLGTIVKTSQAWSANLNTMNKIIFDYIDNAYTFRDMAQGAHEGNLYIDQTQRVEPMVASVGIGMSGKGTFMLPSQPNMKIIMTPKPTYWLIFGNFEEGEALDITQVSEYALKLQYKGTKTMSVEWTGNNTWEIL